MTTQAIDELKAKMIEKTGMCDAQAKKLLRALVVASRLSIQAQGRMTPDEVADVALKVEHEIA